MLLLLGDAALLHAQFAVAVVDSVAFVAAVERVVDLSAALFDVAVPWWPQPISFARDPDSDEAVTDYCC